MELTQISILAGGVLTLLLTVFHIRFPKVFRWDLSLRRVDPATKKILFTIHIALYLLFIVFGLLSLAYSMELGRCEGVAGAMVALYALFWLWRMLWQVFYFRFKQGEEPAKKRPALGYMMIALFFLLFVAYALPVLIKMLT